MSKLYISFLGTGDYKDCRYEFNKEKSTVVKFVQTASVGFFCSDFSLNDRICILCTEKAEEKHFNSLKSEFEKKNLPVPEIVKIPDGSSEEKLWEIFQIVMDKVNDEDELIFDITNSFRSLPLLMTILLQYMKVLKNISIIGVYYGAFEKLGYAKDVESIPVDDRIAPIFDLTPFFSLYDWSIAINNFTEFGRTKTLKKLTSGALKPILKKTKGSDENASALNNLIIAVDEYSKNVLTCRGKGIQDFAYERRIKKNIGLLEKNLIPAVQPVLKKIEYEFSDFNDNDIFNGFNAVSWCIEHDLIQQGVTILQETIISLFVERWNLMKIIKNDLNSREFVSSLLIVKARDLSKNEWKAALNKFEDLATVIYKNINIEIAKEFDALTQIRNDINHAGFIKPKKHDVIRNKLRNSFSIVKNSFLN